MRIGFACMWDPVPAHTWSRTPWQLRAAMREQADVVDVGVQLSAPTRRAVQALHPRWHEGRLRSNWDESRMADVYARRVISRNAARHRCDAVLEIQDMAIVECPYFLYQDMSWDALDRMLDDGREIFRKITRSQLHKRQARQRALYEHAAGVLTMSHWLARSLVEVSGLPPGKVHVVHPGLHRDADIAWKTEQPRRESPRRRLLFVGRHFRGKGGDLLLEALAILRREVDPDITLTVVGLPTWPVQASIPAGVEFLGQMPLADVAALYDKHDLFVLPTRIEGFGFVFLEALARGLPCIGRDDFAMPEFIKPGRNGALLRKDDPVELARLVAETLADDSLYESCRADIPDVIAHFSWERAASDALGAIRRTLSG